MRGCLHTRRRWRVTSIAHDRARSSPRTAPRGAKRTVGAIYSRTDARRLLMSVGDFVCDPREVVASAARDVDDDELGKLVRVKLDEACVQTRQRSPHRLDDELALATLFD